MISALILKREGYQLPVISYHWSLFTVYCSLFELRLRLEAGFFLGSLWCGLSSETKGLYPRVMRGVPTNLPKKALFDVTVHQVAHPQVIDIPVASHPA
jgi:hypothetical protein